MKRVTFCIGLICFVSGKTKPGDYKRIYERLKGKLGIKKSRIKTLFNSDTKLFHYLKLGKPGIRNYLGENLTSQSRLEGLELRSEGRSGVSLQSS